MTKNEIIIHATDTRPEWMENESVEAKVKEIRRWHMEDRGWRDIGYAFIIDRDGHWAGGRDLDNDGDFAEEVGAHVKGYNKNSIGIALVGGYAGASTDKFHDNFTTAQEQSLTRLMGDLMSRFGQLKVSGHNEYANKACPCFNVPDWLSGKKPKPPRKHITESTTIRSNLVVKLAAVAAPIVGIVGDMPWENLALLVGLAAVALIASSIIDMERWKKWVKGDK